MRFVKMMIIEDNNTYLDKCKNMSQVHVFLEIVKAMDSNQLWFSNSDSRKKICDKLDLSDIRLKQIIKYLVNEGLLHKKLKGIYLISQVYMSTISEKV